MQRRDFLHATGSALASVTLLASSPRAAGQEQRPNVLWLSCEDIGPALGCYGDEEAHTPKLDALAGQGARFDAAFGVCGVCAPNRSCIITGIYPTSLGTQNMRSTVDLPPHIKCFPEYLRDAGYYCTNNAKTDYQFAPPKSAWDESSRKAHWRNRPDPSQPFFSVFNFENTHESRVNQPPDSRSLVSAKRALKPEEFHDPQDMKLPPYYPDNPVLRKQWANYYDLVTALDYWVGGLLQELEEDGLAENTVVLYWSDHGVGFPRAKRWPYDSGLRVPLIVRWPGRIEPGSLRSDLVSFVDFAPTALSLAGVPVPGHMQGQVFLGDATPEPREYIFGFRDRMDERADHIRAVRDTRFKYLRNYDPYTPYAQRLAYAEKYDFYRELRRLHESGELEGPERLYWRETKPLEELYDLPADPHELRNLAESEEHAPVLERMRKALDQWMTETVDLGFVPEMELAAWLRDGPKRAPEKARTPYVLPESVDGEKRAFGRSVSEWVDDLNAEDALLRLRAIKSLGVAGAEMTSVFTALLEDWDSAMVHWAAVMLGLCGEEAPDALRALRKTLGHEAASARLGAAQALCMLGRPSEALPAALDALQHENAIVRLYAIRIVEAVGPEVDEAREALEQAAASKNFRERINEISVARTALGQPAPF